MSGDARKLSLAELEELVGLMTTSRGINNGNLGDDGVAHWREITPEILQTAIHDCFWERGTPEQSKLVDAWVRDAWGLHQ